MRQTIFAAAAFAGLMGGAVLAFSPAMAKNYSRVPAAKMQLANDAPLEVAYFAGGCFWGVEAVFEEVDGVKSAVSGFSGGAARDVTYKQITRGNTGHAETVKVVFDPRKTSYAELMQVYFSVIADPTQLNRQGPDVGTHYRSAFFPVDDRQKKQARAYIRQLGQAGVYDKPIVTKLEPFRFFVTAEGYHQDFASKNPRHPYIVRHDAPKVAAYKRIFE